MTTSQKKISGHGFFEKKMSLARFNVIHACLFVPLGPNLCPRMFVC